MGSFTFNLDSIKSTASTTVDRGLYASTKDEDLNYIGNDTIVWDRINGERLRRGLASLTELGTPRPDENTPATAAEATNPDGTAKTFVINGPPGMTFEQAKAIFEKQAKTGGLVGFKPGDALSAATQAADGLPSAQAALAQAQSGVSGAFGSIPGAAAALGGISKSLGPAGGALGGSLAGTAAGLTGAVGPAVSAVSGALSSVNSAVRSIGSALSSGIAGTGAALVGAAGTIGSVATTAIQTINRAITGTPVTSPINTANFVKTDSAVAPIASLSVPQVTATMAAAKNLVGQASSAISNTKGVGSFGFDVSQLETAGLVKPGTNAFIAAGASLTSVLKAPSVWSGKGGISSLDSLLKSPMAQSLTQQDLMTKGVAGMAAVGIPVKNLSAQGLSGMALNAAKSLPNTEAFAKGLPIPGDATGTITASFNQNVRDAAFGVNLADAKIPAPFKAIDIPIPKNNTVNRATVDAASTRIAGNDKIPPPNYGPREDANTDVADLTVIQGKLRELVTLVNKAAIALANVNEKLTALENQQTITSDAWAAIEAEYQAAREVYNVQGPALAGEYNSLRDRASTNVQLVTTNDTKTLQEVVKTLVGRSRDIKSRISQLSSKIEGRGEGE